MPIPQLRRGAVRPVERTAYRVGAVLFASGLVHLVVLVASGPSWEGPLSYRKAMTFGLSFGRRRRGRARNERHRNFETPFDSFVSMTLALGGAVIIVTVLGFTIAALRSTSGLVIAVAAALYAVVIAGTWLVFG